MRRIAFLAALAFASHASADTQHYSFQTRGKGAQATFYAGDACSYVTVNAWESESVTRSVNGAPVTSAYANAFVFGFNWCTGAQMFGFAFADSGFSQNQLNSAAMSLPITITSEICAVVNDEWQCTSSDASATLTVQITGTGDTSRGMSMSHQSSGDYRQIWRQSGSFRSGDATGSLVAGTTDLLAGVAGFAELTTSTSGQNDIYRF
jgi:hypothetical protein